MYNSTSLYYAIVKLPNSYEHAILGPSLANIPSNVFFIHERH